MSKRRRAGGSQRAPTRQVDPASATPAGADRARPLYLGAIALSAFLLFVVELRAGRLVLPVFGGAPAVWTTALCFFTAVLFLGYGYAHLVASRLAPRTGALVHGGLVVLVLVASASAPTDLAPLRNPGLPEAFNVLLVLALIAGPAVFLLSATSPLLSAWFAARGRDPWWLYAASNGASLGGLIAYPILIEPLVPLSAQRWLVLGLLGIVALLIGAVAWTRRAGDSSAAPAIAPAIAPIPPSPAPTTRRQILWLLAAAIPAGLLSATTSHLATDLISAPLLWVGPLAIYLLSLVIAFSERGRRVLPLVERLLPAAATLMWISYVLPGAWPVLVLVVFLLLSYGIVATALHGRLAQDRPDEAHLTRYYLVISAGGLVATAFVALVAPLVFNAIYEYPLLIVAGLALVGLLGARRTATRTPGRLAQEAALDLVPFAVVGLVLLVLVALDDAATAGSAALAFAAGALVIAVGRSAGVLAAGTALAIALVLVANWPNPITRVRTFFGVLDVRTSYFGLARSEFSGTTLHGLQFVDERRTEPTTYYVAEGPLGRVFDVVQGRTPEGARIGAVGLGVGTMAAYGRPNDVITFFEIDQAVVDLARDGRSFTYLADTAADVDVIVGDARLTLAEQPPGSFDLLILDAFSSDAVPAHLLTREALELYVRALRPGGILAFHLSNRYYDLDPAVGSTARAIGLEAYGERFVPDPPTPEGLAARPSIWVVAGAADAVAPFAELDWTRPVPGPVITDDVPDLLRTLRFP